MPLTIDEIGVVKLHAKCFGYMWRPPLKWDTPNYTNPTFQKTLVYMIAVGLQAAHGTCSLIYVTYLQFFANQSHSNQIYMFALPTVAILLATIVALQLLVFNSKIFAFLKDIMFATEKLCHGKCEHSDFSEHYNESSCSYMRLPNFRVDFEQLHFVSHVLHNFGHYFIEARCVWTFNILDNCCCWLPVLKCGHNIFHFAENFKSYNQSVTSCFLFESFYSDS